MLRTYTPLLLLLLSTAAQAQQTMPDMKGVWQGRSEAILRGQVPHYPSPAENPTTPRPGQSDITFNVTSQDGRRFWGTVQIGSGQEVLIGSIAFDRQTIYIIDQDGFADGRLIDPNTADICYRQVSDAFAIISCVEIKRKAK